MMGNWKDVHKGFVVRDKNGQDWTVLDRKPGQVFSISCPVRSWTGQRTGEVEIVSQPTPQDDEHVQNAIAKGMIATKFGGIEIYKQGRDKTQPKRTPVTFVDGGTMLAHLRIFHSSMTDDPTLAGMLRFHTELHDPKAKAAEYEPHVHDPDFDEL